MCILWRMDYEVEFEERMQYLWELHVPLRYRWYFPRMPWLQMWKRHPDRVMEWPVFGEDPVIQNAIARLKSR